MFSTFFLFTYSLHRPWSLRWESLPQRSQHKRRLMKRWEKYLIVDFFYLSGLIITWFKSVSRFIYFSWFFPDYFFLPEFFVFFNIYFFPILSLFSQFSYSKGGGGGGMLLDAIPPFVFIQGGGGGSCNVVEERGWVLTITPDLCTSSRR